MNFSAQLTSFDLDAGRYSKALDLEIQRQMRMAARAFVAAAVRAIPVRTGFVRGAFRNIEEAIGVNIAGSTSSAKIVKKAMASGKMTKADVFLTLASIFKGHIREGKEKGLGSQLPGGGEYYQDGKRKVLKTPQSGRAFATQPEQIFSNKDFIYNFNFNVAISYFNMNDMFANPHTPSSPWNAFSIGRLTFLNYMKTEGLKKLPKVSDFFAETMVTVNGTSVARKKLSVINRSQRLTLS